MLLIYILIHGIFFDFLVLGCCSDDLSSASSSWRESNFPERSARFLFSSRCLEITTSIELSSKDVFLSNFIPIFSKLIYHHLSLPQTPETGCTPRTDSSSWRMAERSFPHLWCESSACTDCHSLPEKTGSCAFSPNRVLGQP